MTGRIVLNPNFTNKKINIFKAMKYIHQLMNNYGFTGKTFWYWNLNIPGKLHQYHNLLIPWIFANQCVDIRHNTGCVSEVFKVFTINYLRCLCFRNGRECNSWEINSNVYLINSRDLISRESLVASRDSWQRSSRFWLADLTHGSRLQDTNPVPHIHESRPMATYGHHNWHFSLKRGVAYQYYFQVSRSKIKVTRGRSNFRPCPLHDWRRFDGGILVDHGSTISSLYWVEDGRWKNTKIIKRVASDYALHA